MVMLSVAGYTTGWRLCILEDDERGEEATIRNGTY
jgi:hypothetical protein